MTEGSTALLAVVTGASSGIGLELAKEFSRNGFDVVICAEDDGLEAATDEIAAPGRSVHSVRADLATASGVPALTDEINALGRPVDALAVNAGIGNAGPFMQTPVEKDVELINLNVTGAVHLTKLLLPGMVDRGAGRILFTASVAGTMPGPYYATYAASKAFLLSFAEAIRYEVKDAGVTVTALLPGPTDTEFFERANMQDTPVWDAKKDDPAEVARDGFEALMAGKHHVVAGSAKNAIQEATARVLPDPAKASLHAQMTKPQR